MEWLGLDWKEVVRHGEKWIGRANGQGEFRFWGVRLLNQWHGKFQKSFCAPARNNQKSKNDELDRKKFWGRSGWTLEWNSRKRRTGCNAFQDISPDYFIWGVYEKRDERREAGEYNRASRCFYSGKQERKIIFAPLKKGVSLTCQRWPFGIDKPNVRQTNKVYSNPVWGCGFRVFVPDMVVSRPTAIQGFFIGKNGV